MPALRRRAANIIKRKTTMKYVLYNNLSGDGRGVESAAALDRLYGEDMTLISVTEIPDLSSLALSLGESDALVICGGDGTLNRFVNIVDTELVRCPIFYLPCGTGNDFATDLGKQGATEPFEVTEQLKGLPTVTVNGETHKFINAVGYGIDGYCSELGDKAKASGKVPNYTAIAIKGMLFGFKPRAATVTVDGVEHRFKKAWLAPAMFGRYYGGGMMAAPEQKRDDKLSVMLFHGYGRLKTLMAFPSIFKGEHVRSKMVTVLCGKEISVKFDTPASLQIDGETMLGVSEYSATAKVAEKV